MRTSQVAKNVCEVSAGMNKDNETVVRFAVGVSDGSRMRVGLQKDHL